MANFVFFSTACSELSELLCYRSPRILAAGLDDYGVRKCSVVFEARMNLVVCHAQCSHAIKRPAPQPCDCATSMRQCRAGFFVQAFYGLHRSVHRSGVEANKVIKTSRFRRTKVAQNAETATRKTVWPIATIRAPAARQRLARRTVAIFPVAQKLLLCASSIE